MERRVYLYILAFLCFILIPSFVFSQVVDEVNKVDIDDINKINGIDVGDIQKINGVEVDPLRCPGVDNPVDFDGNVYKTVLIGTQCWTRRNLESLHYSDGTAIPIAKAYNDNESHVPVYGRLYSWGSVMRGAGFSSSNPSGVQGVCPQGWHVPSDPEFDILESFLGGWDVAGGKMKTTGTIQGGDGLWIYSNVGGTNESGFSGVPAGWWDSYVSEYLGLEAGTYFYSTSKNEHSDYPSGTGLSNYTAETSGSSCAPETRYSVRCVKN